MQRRRLAAAADYLNTHRAARHLAFLAAALGSILLIGYHFGTFDQAIHIPFLKADANPALYPGDAFIALRHNRYSYFWSFFQIAYRMGMLEVSLFAAHLLATYLTFWAAWKLSLALFNDSLAALLTIAALIFPHFGFMGFPIIEFSLLNRTFVLPFLLLAITLHLRKRYRAAFLLLGAAANLHLLTAGLAAGMLFFALLVERRRVGWSSLAQAAAFFLAGAAPLLWLPGGSQQALDLSLRPEWASLIGRSVLAHVFYPFAPVLYIAPLTLSGFSALGLYYIARRSKPATDADRTAGSLLLAAGLMYALGVITVYFLPATLLVELQINRASLYLVIFAYLYFAGYLARVHRAQALSPGGFALLAGVFTSSLLAIFPLAAWLWLQRRRKPGLHRAAASLWIGLSFAAGLVGVAWFGLWQPGIHLFTRPSEWVDVQRWARENTPQQALFITPPEKGGPFEPDWRVASERSTAAQMIDLIEVALAPEYLPVWQQRFELLAPGAAAQFRGDFFENQAITRQAFYALGDGEIANLACALGADYLVVQKPHARPLLVVYENAGYVVYALQAGECRGDH